MTIHTHASPPSHHVVSAERGIAIIIALMAMSLMVALGTALILTTVTETKITTNFRSNSESLYAADAAIERALDDMLTVPDWNNLLNGTVKSALVDGPMSGDRILADGTVLKLNDVLPAGGINSPYYVVVMVADDPSENDGDPLHDGVSPCPVGQLTGCNPGSGVLNMRAEAFGPGGNHKAIELTIARTNTTELERGYTGQRGQDEQNRRARKAAVQSPGKALTNQSLTLAGGGIS